MNGITLHDARPEDAAALVGFHNRVYRANRKPAFWNWKYTRHLPGRSVYVVARAGGRVVGTQGMIPVCLRLGNRVELSGKSENSLLEPALRGSGTWHRIYEHAVELCRSKGMKVIWGFTRARKVWTKSSFAVHDNLVQAVVILNPLTALGAVRRTPRNPGAKLLLTLALPLLSTWSCLRRLLVSHNWGCTLRSAPVTPADLPDLYARIRARYPDTVHVEFDSGYWEWRISGHPHFQYRARYAYRGHQLVAWALVNDHNRAAPAIAEIAFSDCAASRELLRRIVVELAAAGAGVVTFFTNSQHPLGRDLLAAAARLGFAARPAANAFVVRDLTGDRAWERPERWLFSALWFEGYSI